MNISGQFYESERKSSRGRCRARTSLTPVVWITGRVQASQPACVLDALFTSARDASVQTAAKSVRSCGAEEGPALVEPQARTAAQPLDGVAAGDSRPQSIQRTWRLPDPLRKRPTGCLAAPLERASGKSSRCGFTSSALRSDRAVADACRGVRENRGVDGGTDA